MQTEVATENTQDGSELEARKRSAKKWRWRFIWLPIALSILMVPGCVAAPIFDPQTFTTPDGAEAVEGFLFWALLSLPLMMPPMLLLAWLVGRPFIYSAPKLLFMVIGVAVGLSIVNGWHWFLAGGFIAADSSGSPDAAAAVGMGFAATFWLYVMPAIPIAAVVGGVSGLLYGWFRELRR